MIENVQFECINSGKQCNYNDKHLSKLIVIDFYVYWKTVCKIFKLS